MDAKELTGQSLVLFGDETNQQPTSDGRFFIYGAIVIPFAGIATLGHAVNSIRYDYGFAPDADFKFNVRSCPEGLSQHDFRDAKNEVLKQAHAHGVRLMACLVSHDIAGSQGTDITTAWAINALLEGFHRVLDREDARGMCVFDKLPPRIGRSLLREKFKRGLIYGGREKTLERIDLLAESYIGASHMMSVADIVIGALRYCVNQSPPNDATRRLLALVNPMFMSHKLDGSRVIRNWGLIFLPKNVRWRPHLKEYEKLETRLAAEARSLLSQDGGRLLDETRSLPSASRL